MKPEEFLNHTVAAAVGIAEIQGPKFGLELELEGRLVALPDVATKGWNRTHDGSLRGEAIEYTTAGAKTLDETRQLVHELFKKFKENGVKFNDSIRTSTHVHLNFSDRSIKTVVNFFALFTLLEEVLQYYSGEDRKGNLFCISTREAEGIVGILATAVAKCSLMHFAGDRYKYSACNLSTLYKFGTIEIRTMRGASSAEQVLAWVDILNDLYSYSERMKSPVELVRDLSHFGADALMRQIFSPKNYAELIQHFPAIQTLHYSLMEGARLIQVFAYEFEDAFNAKVDVKNIKIEQDMPTMFKNSYLCIYRPNGSSWSCAPETRRFNRPPKFWLDGTRVADDFHIQWSAGDQRFVYFYNDGRSLLCNWKYHPTIADEGPPMELHPLEARRARDLGALEGPDEEDAEGFEIEEMFDHEGDADEENE